MITVLAEKRPQAVIMAGVLGADRDRGGWFEGNGYCVTWCRGHLVRISTPLSASEWTGENLPIIPEKFVLEPVSKDAFGNEPDPEVLERLKVIRGLFSRSESLVNACDAGREGEGIFRNVYEYLECDKPFRRLWADSLTEGALRRAFDDLRPSSDYDLLARAARAREEADWLIGVNATRAATATADADRVLSAGRVQTAVLKMICDRFDEFNAFEAKPFWTIRGEFIKDGEDVRWRSSDHFVVEETANAVMEAVRETWELTVVSVDGFRLALRREKMDKAVPGLSFVVPGSTLTEVERLCSDTEEDVSIALGSRHIMFVIGNTEVISRRLEGDFLDYKKTVATPAKYIVTADRRSLIDAVERVSLIINEKVRSPLRFVFEKNQLLINCSTTLGQASDEVSVAGDGEGMEIGFNNRYVLDALKAAPADEVAIRLVNNVSPCIIVPADESDSFLYMILPVRIRER